MSYVPIIAATTASARAEDLARYIEKTLSEYRRQHPSTSDSDLRQALQIVARRHPPSPTVLRVVLGLGVLVALFGVFFFMQSGGGGSAEGLIGSRPFLVVALGAMVLILAVACGIKGGLGEAERQNSSVLIISGVILLLFLGLASFLFLAFR